MKFTTINQFNAFVQNCEVINLYRKIRADHNNWRNRYFNIGARGSAPVVTNEMFASIHRLAKIKLGFDTWKAASKRTSMVVKSEWHEREVVFDIKAYIDPFDGAYLSVDVSGLRLPNGYKRHFPLRGNMSWQNFDPLDYFKKYIISYFLLPAGRYREIQIRLGLSPTQTIDQVRKWFSIKSRPIYIDSTAIIIKRLRKKRNLIVKDDFDFNDTQLMNLFKVYPTKLKAKRTVVKMPSPFRVLDGFDGDVDELVGHFNDVMDTYDKDVLFV